MRNKNFKKGTVLVYTMVLVVLGVFMATVVLNVATELSIEYDKRNIEISLSNIINTKGDLSMKYARDLNMSGSGFSDAISCPENISMSGASILDSDVDTQLRYLSGSILCVGQHDTLGELKISFNPDYSDIAFAEYQGYQIIVNSGSISGVFTDSDNTFLDLGGTDYISPDGIDDDFDSDDYSVFSTGSISYPDGYIDNDADSKILSFGYIIENSGLYNVFWSNSKMKKYISYNGNNNDGIYKKIGDVSDGYLKLDINTNHRIILYKIDKERYDESNELIIDQTLVGTGQGAGVGYLQNNLSLDSGTGSAYHFDFTINDYALFVENTSSGALSYQIHGEDALSSSGIYLSPLDDSDDTIFGFLGSHMLVDDEGRLIGDQYEVFGLK